MGCVNGANETRWIEGALPLLQQSLLLPQSARVEEVRRRPVLTSSLDYQLYRHPPRTLFTRPQAVDVVSHLLVEGQHLRTLRKRAGTRAPPIVPLERLVEERNAVQSVVV